MRYIQLLLHATMGFRGRFFRSCHLSYSGIENKNFCLALFAGL